MYFNARAQNDDVHERYLDLSSLKTRHLKSNQNNAVTTVTFSVTGHSHLLLPGICYLARLSDRMLVLHQLAWTCKSLCICDPVDHGIMAPAHAYAAAVQIG